MRAFKEGGLFLCETIRVIPFEESPITHIPQKHHLPRIQRAPVLSLIDGVPQIRLVTVPAFVPKLRIALLRREAEPVARSGFFHLLVHGGVIVDVRVGVGNELLVPTLEDETFAISGRFASVFRRLTATDRIAPYLRTVRILEDDKRGADVLEIHRHIGSTSYIVGATAWKDEESLVAIHTIHPFGRRVERILQRHHAHANIFQPTTAVQHVVIAVAHQFRRSQKRRLDQVHAPLEHVGVAIFGQLDGRQFRRLRQKSAIHEHLLIARKCQLHGREFRGFFQ